MDNALTLGFLKSSKVAVVACSDSKMLQEFINYISTDKNTKLVVNTCIRYDCFNILKEQKIETANTIVNMNDTALKQNVSAVLSIELLNCAAALVTARLRGIYFYIPETIKHNVQLFKLHYFASDLRLECEFGENAGFYVVYDYDKTTGIFTERN